MESTRRAATPLINIGNRLQNKTTSTHTTTTPLPLPLSSSQSEAKKKVRPASAVSRLERTPVPLTSSASTSRLALPVSSTTAPTTPTSKLAPTATPSSLTPNVSNVPPPSPRVFLRPLSDLMQSENAEVGRLLSLWDANSSSSSLGLLPNASSTETLNARYESARTLVDVELKAVLSLAKTARERHDDFVKQPGGSSATKRKDKAERKPEDEDDESSSAASQHSETAQESKKVKATRLRKEAAAKKRAAALKKKIADKEEESKDRLKAVLATAMMEAPQPRASSDGDTNAHAHAHAASSRPLSAPPLPSSSSYSNAPTAAAKAASVASALNSVRRRPQSATNTSNSTFGITPSSSSAAAAAAAAPSRGRPVSASQPRLTSSKSSKALLEAQAFASEAENLLLLPRGVRPSTAPAHQASSTAAAAAAAVATTGSSRSPSPSGVRPSSTTRSPSPLRVVDRAAMEDAEAGVYADEADDGFVVEDDSPSRSPSPPPLLLSPGHIRPSSAPGYHTTRGAVPPRPTSSSTAAAAFAASARPSSAAALFHTSQQRIIKVLGPDAVLPPPDALLERALLIMQLQGSIEGNTIAATLLTTQVKEEMARLSHASRRKKERRFKISREKAEQRRLEDITSKDWEARMARLRESKSQTIQTEARQMQFLTGMYMAAFARNIRLALYKVHAAAEELVKRDEAAFVLTRQMRKHSFKCYRFRVKGAINLLGAFFILRLKIWRSRKRRKHVDVIVDFLRAIKRENDKTGGIMRLVARGAELKAYKNKIKCIQRQWLNKRANIAAQKSIIDAQWNTWQEERIAVEVDERMKIEIERLVPVNEEIAKKNRVRKVSKRKPLPYVLPPSRTELRKDMLMNEGGVLSHPLVTPEEIRLNIVRSYLRFGKRMFMDRVQLWSERHARWTERVKIQGRLGIFAVKKMHKSPKKAPDDPFGEKSFSTPRANTTTVEEAGGGGGGGGRARAPTLVPGSPPPRTFFKGTQAAEEEAELNVMEPEPIRPVFRTVLTKQGLDAMVAAGKEYVEAVRDMWDPRGCSCVTDEFGNLVLKQLPSFDYLGNKVALVQEQTLMAMELLGVVGGEGGTAAEEEKMG